MFTIITLTMDMNAQSGNEFTQLDYNQLIFRQIDRIQIIAQSDFVEPAQKLMAFTWSIRLLKGLITKTGKFSVADQEFLDKLKENESARKEIIAKKKSGKGYSNDDNYENLMSSFDLCVDLFGRRGLMYKNVVSGIQKRG